MPDDITACDMSRYWRLVSVSDCPVTGTFWVSRPDQQGTLVQAVKVTVWADPQRTWGRVVTDMIAWVKGDAVHLPEHIAGASASPAVLDRAEAIKAAVLAAARAVDWDHCPGCPKGRGYQQ